MIDRFSKCFHTSDSHSEDVLVSENATDFEEVRRHTREILSDAYGADNPVLVEAPPNSGRSAIACESSTRANEPVTYLAGRSDLYTQTVEWCEATGVSYEVVPSPYQECPTFAGANKGTEIPAHHLYNKGCTVNEIHASESVSTPCHTTNSTCPYIKEVSELKAGIDHVDLLIGTHRHANHSSYVDGRIVILDGFNATPFHTRFPSETNSDILDEPGQIIPYFLEILDDQDGSFPSDIYHDLTDLLEQRSNPEAREEALAWFQKHGISRNDVSDYNFYPPTSYRYDATHLLGPFLTCSLLCMQEIARGIEIAPPPEKGPIREAWFETGVDPEWRCIRDRNTGELFILRPPDLNDAVQVIGLDTIPTVELWDLLFTRGDGFDHQRVIGRKDFQRYLERVLDITTVQIGDGMHHYAGGRVSVADDEHRFDVIRTQEDEPFALISTKKALEEYEEHGWLTQYVKQASSEEQEAGDGNQRDDAGNGQNEDRGLQLATHYAEILNSDDFKQEQVGAIFGSPFPGHEVVKRWGGFCGHSVRPDGRGSNKSFGELGDKIYRHFTHHQVLQALLRFSQHESQQQIRDTTVYISTYALPEWFDVTTELQMQTGAKETATIEELVWAERSAARPPEADHTVKTLTDTIRERVDIDDISENHVRDTLEILQSCDHATVRRNTGRGGADLYRWNRETPLKAMCTNGHLLVVNEKVYSLTLD